MTELAVKIVISLLTALLTLFCVTRCFGILQQANYKGKVYFAWLKKKNNLFYTRLGFLATLSCLSLFLLGLRHIPCDRTLRVFHGAFCGCRKEIRLES